MCYLCLERAWRSRGPQGEPNNVCLFVGCCLFSPSCFLLCLLLNWFFDCKCGRRGRGARGVEQIIMIIIIIIMIIIIIVIMNNNMIIMMIMIIIAGSSGGILIVKW